MKPKVKPSGQEATFKEDEIIVSKTDLRGVITYANEVFARVSGYSRAELIGAPHNIVRHLEMPRCVFKLLWDTIKGGREIFAYVLNLAKDGSHYWVFAHVTPSYDPSGELIGYHSNRRVPYPDALAKVKPLYRQLLSEESRSADPRQGMLNAERSLVKALEAQGVDYSQFVFSLSEHTKFSAALS